MNTELIKFIREEIGELKIEINLNTQIEDDLGVTGEEAKELIIKISSKFNFDIGLFDFDKYFHPEPSSFFQNYGIVSPLTIQMLENAIKNGKLI
jgi:acyl carrier protein